MFGTGRDRECRCREGATQAMHGLRRSMFCRRAMRVMVLAVLPAAAYGQTPPPAMDVYAEEDFQGRPAGPLAAAGWTVKAPAPDTAVDVFDEGTNRFLRLTDMVSSSDSTRHACLASLRLSHIVLPAAVSFRLRVGRGPVGALREDMGVILGPINGPLTLFAKGGEWKRTDGPGNWVSLPVPQPYAVDTWTAFRLEIASDAIRVFVDGRDAGQVPLRPGRLDRLDFTSLRHAAGCLDVDDVVVRCADRERLGYALLPGAVPEVGERFRRNRLGAAVRMAPGKYAAGFSFELDTDAGVARFPVLNDAPVAIGDLPDAPAEVVCRLVDGDGNVRVRSSFPWNPPAGSTLLARRFRVRFVPMPRSAVTGIHTLHFVRVGDLDGDGRPDFLLARGAIAQDAYAHDGRQLWGYHDPDATWEDIRPDTNVPIWDLDRDGRAEVVVPRRLAGALHLCILDGASGKVLRAVPYPRLDRRPSDLRGSIIVADLSGRGHPGDLVVSWDYGHVSAFDAVLNLLWERDVPIGHTPLAVDLDGDGRDELVAGQTLLGPDGTVRWTQDMAALGPDSHVDSPTVARLVGAPVDGPVIASSTGAALLDPSGRVLWKHGTDIDHGQAARFADVLPEVPGPELWVLDRTPAKVLAIDASGAIRRSFSGISWFWVGDWTGDGRDELFVRRGALGGQVIDGDGRTLAPLPDFYSEAIVADVWGDRRVEFVRAVSDGAEAWIEVYANAEDNPHAATADEPSIRPNRKDLANWTCY